jgi:hypothetical protein
MREAASFGVGCLGQFVQRCEAKRDPLIIRFFVGYGTKMIGDSRTGTLIEQRYFLTEDYALLCLCFQFPLRVHQQ